MFVILFLTGQFDREIDLDWVKVVTALMQVSVKGRPHCNNGGLDGELEA